jgi:hypothetical protein
MKRPSDAVKAKPNGNKPRIFAMSFASVYPLYVQKAERKGRTKQEVDQIITWLSSYSGVRVEEIADPLMRQIRYLDKLSVS